MRQIKFRVFYPWAKKVGLREMEYFDLDNRPYEMTSHPNILMQFTGLHDKNGKEIWEGDIVKNLSGAYGAYDDVVTKIEYSESQGAFIDKYWGDTLDHYEFMEVLGNIYENQDLIK